MSQPALPSEIFQPEQFGPYELRSHLGRGGMADVYKAREEKVLGISRFVVIKRILLDYCADPLFVELFINEARIAAQLNHANIAHIYDVGEIDGMLYLCMEYVRGLDLLRILERAREHGTRLPPTFGAYVMRHIAAALDSAHGHSGDNEQPQPIIHRDVSPPNIMISKDGQIKLVDFGIAKAVSETGDATRTRSMKGKICYMAPEQLSHGFCTPQTDLFSAGVVLHEALTGQQLFLGATDYDTMTRVMSAEIPTPSSLNPAVPADLDRIVMKALARAPEERYQRATDLMRDLDVMLSPSRGCTTLAADVVRIFATEKDREGWSLGNLTDPSRPRDDREVTSAIVLRATQLRMRTMSGTTSSHAIVTAPGRGQSTGRIPGQMSGQAPGQGTGPLAAQAGPGSAEQAGEPPPPSLASRLSQNVGPMLLGVLVAVLIVAGIDYLVDRRAVPARSDGAGQASHAKRPLVVPPLVEPGAHTLFPSLAATPSPIAPVTPLAPGAVGDDPQAAAAQGSLPGPSLAAVRSPQPSPPPVPLRDASDAAAEISGPPFFTVFPVPEATAPAGQVPSLVGVPAAEGARIQLRSLPSGGMVYSGPRRLGKTPMWLVIPAGEDNLPVTVEMDGRPDLNYTVRSNEAPEVVLRLPPPVRRRPAETRPGGKTDAKAASKPAAKPGANADPRKPPPPGKTWR